MPIKEKSIQTENKQWFAVYTYFRREKSVLNELTKTGIEAFVPLVSKTRRYERKIKSYQIPLINHYVFVRIKKEDYVRVLQVRDVIKFVKFSKEPEAIPEREINILKRICGEVYASDIELTKPQKIGELVEIISGNLAGMTARLIQKMNNDQVVIDLYHLDCSLIIQLDITSLRKIKKIRKVDPLSV